MKCSKCEIDYPDNCVSPLAVSDGKGLSYIQLCGICALEYTNQFHSIKRTKFNGELAEEMRQNAIEYRKKIGYAQKN